MNKVQLAIGIACFLIALAIILFASGFKVIYSSALFIIFGILIIRNVMRRSKNAE